MSNAMSMLRFRHGVVPLRLVTENAGATDLRAFSRSWSALGALE